MTPSHVPTGISGAITTGVSGENLAIDVHNSGVVPPGMRSVFFDRYATHGKKGGTGLGTYVAALIARTHGGSVSFTTDDSEGTHVTVSLPATQTR